MVNQQLRRFGSKLTVDAIQRFGTKARDTVRRFGSKVTQGLNRAGDFAEKALPVAEQVLGLVPGGRAAVPMLQHAADMFSRVRKGADRINNAIQQT